MTSDLKSLYGTQVHRHIPFMHMYIVMIIFFKFEGVTGKDPDLALTQDLLPLPKSSQGQPTPNLL